MWLATVAVFSTQMFGASNTGNTLRAILRFLHFDVTGTSFETLHYVLRKAAHFTAYGTLSALFFRALRGTDLHKAIWKWRYAFISLMTCLVTASADEIHQTVTHGRTGHWHDVVLDLLGATFAQTAILFVLSTSWAQSRWRVGAGVNKSRLAATSARVAER